jgi:hypothetical protein
MGQLIYLMQDADDRAVATAPGDAGDDGDLDARRNLARTAIGETVASVDYLRNQSNGF